MSDDGITSHTPADHVDQADQCEPSRLEGVLPAPEPAVVRMVVV